jgi:biotin carboxylase
MQREDRDPSVLPKGVVDRRIMIVGGGRDQVDLITAAQARDIFTIVVDRDPGAPGLAVADVGLKISTRDTQACIGAARRYGVHGVASNASEAAVETVAAVSAALRLPGPSPDIARRSTNKEAMKEAFLAAGVPTPPGLVVVDCPEARSAGRRIGYPIIVKPVDSSGSRGVLRVNHESGMNAALSRSLSESRVGRCLVERFVSGIELSADAFSSGGRTEILGMADKEKVETGSGNVSMNIVYPARLPPEEVAIATDVLRQAVSSVGICDGPSHTEMIWRGPGDFVVLEVAARGGGFWTFSRLIPAISGVDTMGAVLDLARGLRVSAVPEGKGAAVLRFTTAPPGRITGLGPIDVVRSLPGVLMAGYLAGVGDTVRELCSDGDRIGYVMVAGENREAVMASADRAAGLLTVETVAS